MTTSATDGGDRPQPTLGDVARDRPARRYLPYVVLATVAVAFVPVAVVWVLRADRDVTSPWVCIALAVALALIAAALGSAAWKRRAAAGDLMFSELLIWGWVRRLRMERKFADAFELLELAGGDERSAEALTPADRWHALGTLALVVEALDAYTIGHSRRVARHATVISRRLGLPDEQIKTIAAAAAVHDVGKVFTPRAILNKPSALTDDEYDAVKRHSEDGAVIVACLGDPELTAIVRYHHERLDGTGYPAGLIGDAIPVGARIVAVADTYDAIIELRPYRRPASHKHAIEVLLAEQGTHLDPEVVQAFLRGYAGRRALVLWTMLAVLPQRAFSFGGGGAGGAGATGSRPRTPIGQRATIAAVGAVLAAAAFALASPGVGKVVHPPARLPLVAQRTAPARVVPPRHRRPARARAAARPAPAAPSTCLAYNSQLCTIVDTGARGGATGATGAAGAGAATTTSGSLPFTGVDVDLLVALGMALIALGAGVRSAAARGLKPSPVRRSRGAASVPGTCSEPPWRLRAGRQGGSSARGPDRRSRG
jgi:response regulator RpfG family c-di-GMP phosphodiesterase